MQTIDITTAHNVTIEYELATLRDRILALIIDVVIVAAVYLLLFVILVNLFPFSIDNSPFLGYLLATLLPIGLFVLYSFFSEMIMNGQTLGKKSIGLRVVRIDGKEPELSDYLIRSVFHLLDTLFSSGIVGALLIGSSSKKQRLGDIIAHTTVIRTRFDLRFRLEDILRINTLSNYQPVYPQVKNLNEQDMLLVKIILSRYQKYPNEAHRKSLQLLMDKVAEKLDISERPADERTFLRTLLKDYIVLTR
jgi:uncharacterized RDD family membrane protein YckC